MVSTIRPVNRRPTRRLNFMRPRDRSYESSLKNRALEQRLHGFCRRRLAWTHHAADYDAAVVLSGHIVGLAASSNPGPSSSSLM